jgi:VWFA-related protein
MRLRFAVIGLAIVAASTIAGAQQRSVFRSEANYVEVDAVVTDAQGHFVTGLTPADFVVREAYKPQPLDIVEYVNLGSKGTAPVGPVAETRVSSGLGLQPKDLKGRIYLLYFNLADTPALAEVGAQARLFIEDFVEPGDLVGLWNSDAMSQTLTFTTDKKELLQSLPPLGHVASGGVSHSGAQIGKLDDAVAFLAGIQGRRKALILFSPGWPATSFGQWGTNAAASIPWAGLPGPITSGIVPLSGPSWNTPSDVTGRADVQIYTVDSRGLAAAPLWGRTHQQLSAGLDEMTWSTDMLRSIADETGGLAIFNTNDYRQGFARIVEDNSRYYVLGYSSAIKDRNHRFIPVDVKSTRPGLTVRTRKGYFTQ